MRAFPIAETETIIAAEAVFEENGAISPATNGGDHWAVGNGAELDGTNGYPIISSRQLYAVAGTCEAGDFTIQIVRNNGAIAGTYTITAGTGNVQLVSPPIQLAPGDYVHPRTTAVNGATVGTVLFGFVDNTPPTPGFSIGDAADVDLTGAAENDVLVRDAAGIYRSEAPSGGGVDIAAVQAIAAGSTLGLQQQLLADAAQPGLTVLAVGYTNTGKVMGISLGSGNVVKVYANGTDFNAGTVLYREFMSFGEPIIFTGLTNGAIITSTQGFYGYSEQFDGNAESPMPLLSYGLSFTSSFLFGFRNSQDFGGAPNRGFIHVVNGPLDNTIELTFGDGTVVQGQSGISLTPWQHFTLETDGNVEYILNGINPIMACVHANMSNLDGVTGTNQFYDSRLVMPLTNDGITNPNNGFASAPFDGTAVEWFSRQNTEGSFTINPGSPVDTEAATGINTADYEPDGWVRFKATGLISAYSGADSAGLEATPMMPISAMSQVVAQPFLIQDNGDGGNSGVAIASPFEGTARIFEWNGTALQQAYTVPLTRNGVTVTTQDDQNHPAAGLVANETANGTVALVGTLQPGVVIADVPITVVAQAGQVDSTTTFRSQNGTTATNLVHEDDETLMLGITPAFIAAEIREDVNGVLRRRQIDGSGTETWVVA